MYTWHVDPANGDELGTVPEMGLAETKEAIQAASDAFSSWSKTTSGEKAFSHASAFGKRALMELTFQVAILIVAMISRLG